jgi:hypothetical protein
MSTFPNPSVRGVFRDLAVTIVPEAARLEERGWGELESIIGKALAARPSELRRRLTLFIHVLNVLPLFVHGRTFEGLDPIRRDRFLQGVQDAPLLLVRRGFWGLRTLVFMGYYGREEGRSETGYRADARGWEARR